MNWKTKAFVQAALSRLPMGRRMHRKLQDLAGSSRLDIDQYAAHGGAFPVIVRDVGVVGTVTVSGLPQEEDHRLVVQVLREFLAGYSSRASPLRS